MFYAAFVDEIEKIADIYSRDYMRNRPDPEPAASPKPAASSQPSGKWYSVEKSPGKVKVNIRVPPRAIIPLAVAAALPPAVAAAWYLKRRLSRRKEDKK